MLREMDKLRGQLAAERAAHAQTREKLGGHRCTPAERKALDLVAEARAAWSKRDPHDDFRFGMPSLMALGRDIEAELARRGEKP